MQKGNFIQRVLQFAERKGFYMILGLCVVAIGVSTYVLFFTAPQPVPMIGEAVVQETEAVKETSRPTTPIEKDPITTIHIKAAGDLNVTDSVVNAGVAVGGFDFGTVFNWGGSGESDSNSITGFMNNIAWSGTNTFVSSWETIANGVEKAMNDTVEVFKNLD